MCTVQTVYDRYNNIERTVELDQNMKNELTANIAPPVKKMKCYYLIDNYSQITYNLLGG